MNEVWWNDAERDETHEAAADWFAKLQRADVSPEEILAWQRWMAAHSRNAEAFARIEDVCAVLREVKRPAALAALRFGQRHYDATVSISKWRVRSRARSWIAIAASMVVALVPLSWLTRDHGFWSPEGSQIIGTRVGENRTVQLADGSKVTLGGNTRIRARFSSTARQIELTEGEAYFVVIRERSRPFEVRAGETIVTAIGTEFNVRRRQDRIDVTVVKGQVIVNPGVTMSPLTHRSLSTMVTLSADEKFIISDIDVKPTHVEDADASVAWRSGRLVFDREPLRDVLEDINRYSKKRIVAEDPTIGELMFTGTVMDGNVEGWISSVENIFALQAVEESDRIVLRRRAK
jgi:transmembrane sensor